MSKLTYVDIRSVCSTIRIYVDTAGIGTWVPNLKSIDLWANWDFDKAILIGSLENIAIKLSLGTSIDIVYCSGCAQAYIENNKLYIYPTATYDNVYIKLGLVNVLE